MIINDVAEYVQQVIPHPPFFIQNLLPRGGSLLLYGRAGEMKSWIVQHMGYCIATGTPWLDFPTTQARCLICNFEISPAGYHERLVLMSTSYQLEPQKLYVTSPSFMPLEEPAVFNAFKAEVDAVNPDVIILDCLSGCFGGDENSSEQMSNLIRSFGELKGETRGVIIVHHSNKNLMVVNPMDKARGHSKLVGYVDSIVYVVSQPTGKQLQFGKTRLCPFEVHSRNITFDNYVWRVS